MDDIRGFINDNLKSLLDKTNQDILLYKKPIGKSYLLFRTDIGSMENDLEFDSLQDIEIYLMIQNKKNVLHTKAKT